MTTDRTFLIAHTGDHFAPLARSTGATSSRTASSRRKAPESAFAPVWCAWGYEREFTVEQVVATLPKVRELGFEWAVLDDGWQTNEGDWHLDPRKFPRGDADMRAFAEADPRAGHASAPVDRAACGRPGQRRAARSRGHAAARPGGAVQKVSWWNALTQCPAYQPTIDYYVGADEEDHRRLGLRRASSSTASI